MSTIELAPMARRLIEREAAASADGRETGGILLGFDAPAAGRLVIVQAGDPGPNAIRRSDFFRRDLVHAEELAGAAYALDGAEWVGDWHTHPDGGGGPSTTDLDGYARVLDVVAGMDVFVSIIVTPNPRSAWRRPRLHPWLIQAGRPRPGVRRAA